MNGASTRPSFCRCVRSEYVIAGWLCCACGGGYNGLQRALCRHCGHLRCTPLAPSHEGEQWETYEDAYRGDPELLAQIQTQMRRQAGKPE
jgi:hypothetical protein